MQPSSATSNDVLLMRLYAGGWGVMLLLLGAMLSSCMVAELGVAGVAMVQRGSL